MSRRTEPRSDAQAKRENGARERIDEALRLLNHDHDAIGRVLRGAAVLHLGPDWRAAVGRWTEQRP